MMVVMDLVSNEVADAVFGRCSRTGSTTAHKLGTCTGTLPGTTILTKPRLLEHVYASVEKAVFYTFRSEGESRRVQRAPAEVTGVLRSRLAMIDNVQKGLAHYKTESLTRRNLRLVYELHTNAFCVEDHTEAMVEISELPSQDSSKGDQARLVVHDTRPRPEFRQKADEVQLLEMEKHQLYLTRINRFQEGQLSALTSSILELQQQNHHLSARLKSRDRRVHRQLQTELETTKRERTGLQFVYKDQLNVLRRKIEEMQSLQKRFNSMAKKVAFMVNCNICSAITLPGENWAVKLEEELEEGNRPSIFLSCGHVLCDECWKLHSEAQDRSSWQSTCPFCRSPAPTASRIFFT